MSGTHDRGDVTGSAGQRGDDTTFRPDHRGANWRGWLFVAMLAISVVVLFAPGPAVPSGPPGLDKVIHGGLFAALAITGALAASGIRWVRRRWLQRRWVWPALAAYAGGSELVQPLLARGGDVADLVADLIGLVVGAAVAYGAAAWWDRRRSR